MFGQKGDLSPKGLDSEPKVRTQPVDPVPETPDLGAETVHLVKLEVFRIHIKSQTRTKISENTNIRKSNPHPFRVMDVHGNGMAKGQEQYDTGTEESHCYAQWRRPEECVHGLDMFQRLKLQFQPHPFRQTFATHTHTHTQNSLHLDSLTPSASRSVVESEGE